MSDVLASCPVGKLLAITKRKGTRPQTHLVVQFNDQDSLTAILSSAARAKDLPIGESYHLCSSQLFNRSSWTSYDGEKVHITKSLDRTPIPLTEPE